MLFGRRREERLGQFHGYLYDARVKFSADPNSKRWRILYDKDQYGRPIREAGRLKNARREHGVWQDAGDASGTSPTQAEIAAIGEGPTEDWFRIPFGNQAGGYRDLNVQFAQMNQKDQTVAILKPATLITDSTNPLGPVLLSTIQNKVQSAKADGFIQTPPQSHFMDPDPASGNFGKWIEPENAQLLEAVIDPAYWNASSTLKVRLKHGISHLHLWCPSGEYREFDTRDKVNWKVTELPFFEAPEVSLVVKTGWELGTDWDIFLMPQRVQLQSHWVDYYDAFTFFTYFVIGLHNIRNTLTRLPAWPVPYGYVGSDLSDIFGIDDWVYYMAQWHGPFSPGPVNLHPRPVGFGDAGGEENFNPALLTGGIWEGSPAHGGDYSLEYAIGHQTLLQHNVHDFEAFSPFFAIIFSHSTPVGYFARLALQQVGDLAAVVKARGSNYRSTGGKFYIWQRTVKGEIAQTMNWGTLLWDFELAGAVPADSSYSLDAALSLGGWR